MMWTEWADNNRQLILELCGEGRELGELKEALAKSVPDEVGGCKNATALLSIYRASNNHFLKIRGKDKKSMVTPIKKEGVAAG